MRRLLPWSLFVALVFAPACGRLGYGGTVPGIRESDGSVTMSGDDGGTPPFDDAAIPPVCDGEGCVRGCDELPGAVVFCDEFDETQLDPDWTTQFGFQGPVPVVDRTIVHSGTGSLHFTATDTSFEPANYLVHNIDEVPGNKVYVRAYVWYPADTNQGSKFLRVITGSAYPNIHHLAAITKTDGTMSFAVYDNTAGTTAFATPPAPMPRGQWACVQLHITRGVVGGGASAELTVNGASAGAFTDYDTSQPVTTIHLGPMANSACGEVGTCDAGPEIYIDQLAVGSEELPCDG